MHPTQLSREYHVGKAYPEGTTHCNMTIFSLAVVLRRNPDLPSKLALFSDKMTCSARLVLQSWNVAGSIERC